MIEVFRCYTSSSVAVMATPVLLENKKVASSLKLADKNPRERGIFAYSDIILPIKDTALILRARL